MIPNNQRNDFTKSKTHGLYRYNPTGGYFARVRFRGKLYRKKLETDNYELARRKLADFRRDLERTDASKGNTSFSKVLDDYSSTLTGAASTLKTAPGLVQRSHPGAEVMLFPNGEQPRALVVPAKELVRELNGEIASRKAE